eukprot:gb/GECG01013439.1/.p1 GENE.gb/GECG01013439.1/~~gb/GECG01013439.1/.p1  ORF type:complete len:389 (+),score=50.83 gb/GECG01013439.1/:1-1167(+)
MKMQMQMLPRILQRFAKFISRAPSIGKKMQATLDYRRAALLLELNEARQEIVDDTELMWYDGQITSVEMHVNQFIRSYSRLVNSLRRRFDNMDLASLIPLTNEKITVQVSEMFQHLYDVDSGNAPVSPTLPELDESDTNAAEQPSIGPSTHTNPYMTLDFQMKMLAQEKEEESLRQLREILTQRQGFSLWLGPSQAPTPNHKVGVYLKGFADVGQVVALFPGAVYNSEMRQKAIDFGHFGNPDVPRVVIPRYDDTILDVHGASSDAFNPLAVAHHVRHPPRKIQPNVMRIQYDFIDGDQNTYMSLEFPKHLRPYVPNKWGTDLTTGQALHGLLEQSIYMKGVVLVATRQILDEELFVDHQLNPFQQLPPWYESKSVDSDSRIWRQISS